MNQMNAQMNPMSNDKNRMEAKINKVLPAEMLERILRELEPKDLKNAVLVCKRWAKVNTTGIQNRLFTIVPGWGGSCPVDLGCPHLGQEEPGSHQLRQAARPEEGPGLPQLVLYLLPLPGPNTRLICVKTV